MIILLFSMKLKINSNKNKRYNQSSIIKNNDVISLFIIKIFLITIYFVSWLFVQIDCAKKQNYFT